MKFSMNAIVVLGLLTVCLILPEVQAQSYFGPSNIPSNSPFMRSELGRRMAYEQMRARSKQRQKRLESDTDKLVGLVTDLQKEMQSDKALSPSDLSKRAAEIEKLAHSVQDKMKGDS